MSSPVKVTFHPENIDVSVPFGATIKDAVTLAGIFIDFPCGGQGRCGKCKVEIEATPSQQNHADKHLPTKESKRDTRLSCQTKLEHDTVIFIPKNIQPDRKKLVSTIRNQRYPFHPLIKKNRPSYGLALDIGTTTVFGILIDLTTGDDLATVSETNTQAIHGADVISRINYAITQENGLSNLQQKIIKVINKIIERLAAITSINTIDINDITIVGNTVMQHLLVNASMETLAAMPFEPAYTGHRNIKSKELGITTNPDANVYVFPHIAGFVGGDTVGLILALGLHHSDKINLAIDIGTNGEIVLGSKKQLVCTSTAAGPAFEGVRINNGMRANTGAIESLRITNEGVFYKTIGNTPPEGICGSGLLDAMADLIKLKIIDDTGKFRPKKQLEITNNLSHTLLDSIRHNSFVISKSGRNDIIITQEDIREIQLAKAAISAGIQILKNQLDVADDDIEHIFIAGTFGNYIDKKNAQIIGLIPNTALEKVVFVGNAAAEGARLALISQNAREETENIAHTTNFLNLSTDASFQDAFAESIYFNN
ncbi:MAG: ASKHA domain-containing protein [Planctomycetota bacterium]